MAHAYDCIFCKILAGKSEVSLVYRDETCAAFMDIQPINPGHLLVVPIRHAADLAALKAKEGERMFRVAQRLAAALGRSGVKCEGVNLFLADGEAAMQEVFHVHLHVLPRYAGDGFGFKFPAGYFRKPSREELNKIARKIRDGFEVA
jgi:histidine triad (HIT) family protein